MILEIQVPRLNITWDEYYNLTIDVNHPRHPLLSNYILSYLNVTKEITKNKITVSTKNIFVNVIYMRVNDDKCLTN